jgi:hypothetical protein
VENLIERARGYEQRWGDSFPIDFMDNLRSALSYLEIDRIVPGLKQEAICAAEYLCGASLDMINRLGKVKWWQWRRREYRQFALEIAELASELQRKASR